jgi:hypothetical protein
MSTSSKGFTQAKVVAWLWVLWSRTRGCFPGTYFCVQNKPSLIHCPEGCRRTASVVWWSEFLATDPEARVRLTALPDFLKKKKKRKTVVGLERGPLSLVNTTEELLDRKVAAPV